MLTHNTATANAPEDHYLRLPQVRARIGISKTHVYKLIGDGKFPAPTKLGPRTSVWRASEITAWMNSQGGQA